MSPCSNELFIIHGTDYRAMAGQLMRACHATEYIPSKETLIGIKPNLLGPIPADEGATTHPEVVEGIITYLQEEGYHHLVMLESSWVGDKTTDSLLVTGFDELSRRTGVPFWDLQEDQGIGLDCAGMDLKVCERALTVGFLINVPVLKGHCQTGVTCALKNMKGLLPASEKRRFHRLGLHEPIGHLSAGCRQDLIIVDNICGDLTCEDGGNPVRMDRLIGGTDPVLIDTLAAGVVGLSPEQVPYIRIAEALGVGQGDLCSSRLWYGELDACAGTCDRMALLSPQEAEELIHAGAGRVQKTLDVSEMTQEVDSCSACYAALVPALRRLEQEGMLERLDSKVCIGQGFQGRSGAIGVGRCTAQFTHHLSGCPPTQEQIYDFLKKLTM